MRKSTVLSHPFQKGFPACTLKKVYNIAPAVFKVTRELKQKRLSILISPEKEKEETSKKKKKVFFIQNTFLNRNIVISLS
jgi:hypothetical protein